MRTFWLVLVPLLLWSGRGLAQTVTLTFLSDPGGITLAGSGTSAVSLGFGTVQAFGGAVPTGVTETANSTSFTLSTPVDVQVMKSGLVSSSYTLTGQLQASDLQNAWEWNSVTLSTASATITTSGAYGIAANAFSLTVPFSASAGVISNTIDFTVVAN